MNKGISKTISKDVRGKLVSDEFMDACAKCAELHPQWHHVNYLNSRVDHEKFIVPACESCHRKVDESHVYKNYFRMLVCLRLTEEEKNTIHKHGIKYFESGNEPDKKINTGYQNSFLPDEPKYIKWFNENEFMEFKLKDVLSGKLWSYHYSQSNIEKII